jgi:hypothetical protein
MPLVAVLTEYQHRTKLGRALPHEASVIDVELDVVLVAKVEEDRAVAFAVPPLLVDEKALLKGCVRGVSKWCSPVEVVDLLLDVQ